MILLQTISYLVPTVNETAYDTVFKHTLIRSEYYIMRIVICVLRSVPTICSGYSNLREYNS